MTKIIMKIKSVLLSIVVLSVIGSIIFFAYRSASEKTNKDLAKRMAELSPRGGPPQSIEGLRQAIALYEAQIERNVREGAQTGVYWKILATRLADSGMHRDALASLERAIYFNAEDPVLYYLTGVSAGTVAKSEVGFSSSSASEKAHYYKLSESSYLRALELDSSYTKPMMGLGVLYTFELNEPEKAIPHLENFLKIQSGDVSAMFILARAFYMSRRFRDAIELYERIITRTKNQKFREEAMNNIELIERMMYE